MESRRVGYLLHPLVDGAVVANSVKCRFPPNQTPYFVLARRRSVVFMKIGENGPVPQSEVKFNKVVASMRVVTAKSLGKQSGTDLLVVVFHDYSMMVFGEPKRVKFQYPGDAESDLVRKVCDVHQYAPILLIQKRLGYLSYWNVQEAPKTMFDIRCEDMTIVDMKFIPHSSIRLAVLYESVKKERSVMAYSFDVKLLTLDRLPALCVNGCTDRTASILVPLPHGSAERPVFLILGSNCVEARFRSKSATYTAPFGEHRPTAYCELGGCFYVVADSGGSLYVLNADGKVEFKCLGKVDTVPTSLTHVDGDIIFVGSDRGNSMFVSCRNFELTVYTVIEQFTPVNSFSKFCQATGSIYMTQGDAERAMLSSITTGIQFTPELELEMCGVTNIFGAAPDLVVATTSARQSYCICIGENSEIGAVPKPDNFIDEDETIAVIKRDAQSFIQVTHHDVRIVGSHTDMASMHFDCDIIGAYSSNREIVLLFADSAEVITYNLSSLRQVSFQQNNAVCAAVHNEILAVFFTNGEVRMYLPNEKVVSSTIKRQSLCNSLLFSACGDRLYLVATLVDGWIETFSLPDLAEGPSVECGFFVYNSFQLDESSIFINSTSPRIWHVDGVSVPVLCPKHTASCLLSESSKGMTKLALVLQDKLVIGNIMRSSICSIHQRPSILQPLLYSVHEKPLSLFVTMQRDDLFLVSAFILPSFSHIFQHPFEPGEEITCLHYSRAMEMTFCGTASQQDGKLVAIGERFHEMKILQTLLVKGSVFCMAEAGERELVLGGSCCVLRVKVDMSLSGVLTLEVVQIVQTAVIPRSLSSVGHLVVNFGVARCIGILSHNSDGLMETVAKSIISSRVHTGFAGAPLSPLSCHLFTVEMAHSSLGRKFAIWAMKIDQQNESAIDIKRLTEMQLEGPVSSFTYAKPGFSMLATRDGALYVLMEHDRSKVHTMKKLLRQMGDITGIQIQDTAVIDTHSLSLFEFLPSDIQSRIVSKLKMSREDALSLIHGISEQVSNLCSI